MRCDGLHSLGECDEKEVGFRERVERGDFWWVEGGEEVVKGDFKLSQWKVERGRAVGL